MMPATGSTPPALNSEGSNGLSTWESRLPEAVPEAIPIADSMPMRVQTLPPSRNNDGFAEPPVDGIRPLQYLQYRWVMLLFLGGFLGSVLAFTAYSLIPSKYTTYSLIRVSPQDPTIFYREDPHGRNDFASYLKTQADMLRSHFVLNAAIRDPKVAQQTMLKEQVDPVRFLEEELLIEYREGSELIKLKLSGDDPRAISMIVNSIQDAFFREIVEDELKRKKARLEQVERAIVTMKTDLEKKSNRPAVENPLLPKVLETLPGIGPQVAGNQLVRLKESLFKIDADLQHQEREKKSIQQRKENLQSELPPLPAGLSAQLEGDPTIVGLNRKIDQLQKTLKYLLDLNKDPNAEGTKETRARIEEAQLDRERVRKERAAEFQRAQIGDVERRLQMELERCDGTIQDLRSIQEKTKASIKEYETTLAKIMPAGDQPRDFDKVGIESSNSIITGLIDMSNRLRLEVNAPPRVRPFQAASVPMKKKEMKKQILGTVIAGLAGFGIVGLGIILYEARIRRVMSFSEVQKMTLGPILGAVPSPGNGTSTRSSAEEFLIGDALEKTRIALMQQFGQPGSKVILITSALTEEGKTFLVNGLANGFAVCGSRTLIVDFDLRTPSLHTALGASNERGVCELLCGEVDLRSALLSLTNGAYLLCAGTWQDAVRHALVPERLAPFFSSLRDSFDCIVVNSHPMLAVAETFTLGRFADAVVLTVEKNISRRTMVSRAQEKIAGLSPEAFGVVFIGATREEYLN